MYFPKSQIETNLFTNGGELRNTETLEEYKGYYFKTANEEYYSGKIPSSISNKLEKIRTNTVLPSNIESEPLPNTYNITNRGYYLSQNLSDNEDIAPTYPKFIYNPPTESDYENEKYYRYFLKKVNENIFIEINNEEYLKYKNKSPLVSYPLFTPLKLLWLIKGDKEFVFNKNQQSVNTIERNKKVFGLSSFLNNNFTLFLK